MKTIRWGIIGCGDVCEVKSGPALQQSGDSTIVNVMRRDAAKAADFAKRHGVPRSTGDADSLIADPEVDAVYIATPVGSHLEHALRVAEAGKPCLVEKPMARNLTECRQMIDAFDRAGAKLFVAYYRRCLPWFERVKQLIDSGKIGQLTSVTTIFTSAGQRQPSGQWRLEAEQSGGGLFMDLASHTLDLLDFLLGPIEQVHGIATNRAGITAAEDNVAMSFRFASGVTGTGSWDFAAAKNADVIQLNGSGGRATFSTFGRRVDFVDAEGKQETFDEPAVPHVHQPFVRTLVHELLGRGACPSTGRSAARTAAVMDRVLSDYYGGREDAFWLREATWPGRTNNEKRSS